MACQPNIGLKISSSICLFSRMFACTLNFLWFRFHVFIFIYSFVFMLLFLCAECFSLPTFDFVFTSGSQLLHVSNAFTGFSAQSKMPTFSLSHSCIYTHTHITQTHEPKCQPFFPLAKSCNNHTFKYDVERRFSRCMCIYVRLSKCMLYLIA